MKTLEECLEEKPEGGLKLAKLLKINPLKLKESTSELTKPKNLRIILEDIYNYFDITKRKSIQSWDKELLPALYVQKESFSEDKNKVKLLVEAESDILIDDIKDLSPSEDYKSYNEQVLKKMQALGINVTNWVNGNYNFSTTIPTENGQESIFFKQWSRDFKKEFGIGNYSECCIGLGGDTNDSYYPDVLVDYFLDYKINVIKISNEQEEIGQIYFVALADEDLNPVLGVTSIEIGAKHAKNKELGKEIASRISGDNNSIKDYFGFDRALASSRSSALKVTVESYHRDLGRFHQSLKQRRDKTRSRKRNLIETSGEEKSKLEYLKELINQGTNLLQEVEELKSALYGEKMTFNLITTNTNYKGTNYLDIIGGKFRVPSNKPRRLYDLDKINYPKIDSLIQTIEEYKAETK